jgi:hypothetical protein
MICSPMIPTKHHKKKMNSFFGSMFYNKQCIVLALRTMHCWKKHPLFCEHHVDDATLTTSIKQNTQQRTKERTKRGPKSKPEKQNPKWATKEQKHKLCSKTSWVTKKNKHIGKKQKKWKTWKKKMENFSNPRRAITCNNGVFQSKDNLNSLQSYQHPLPIKHT